MKPQLGGDEVKRAWVMPNAWMRPRKLASSYLYHRASASVSLLRYRAWYISSMSVLVRWMLPAALRCSRSVIMASFIVDAAGYSAEALTLPQTAPVARSWTTMPIEPGVPARELRTSPIRCCISQEKPGAIPEQVGVGLGVGLGVGDGDGGRDASAGVPTWAAAAWPLWPFWPPRRPQPATPRAARRQQ